MGQLVCDISTSLDGFVAGPDPTLEEPLGKGGEQIHDWGIATRSWRESHGREGGEESRDGELMAEAIARAGATIMGRRMFSGGEGPWQSDPNPNGWWGDEPPFHHPVFVLTHHEREPLELTGTTFTFVTDGIESALEQANAAAAEKDVKVAGGADAIRQYLNAGLLDELEIHVTPILLGGGTRLLETVSADAELKIDRIVDSPAVTHLRYRIVR